MNEIVKQNTIEYDYNELFVHVRKRPGMYIGSTNFRGVRRIIDILCNNLIICNKRNIVIDINDDNIRIQYENEQIPNNLDIDVIKILSSEFHHENNILRFSLDKEIFGSTNINYDVLFDVFRELAFLNKGIVITYNGYEFCYKKGLVDFYQYFAYLNDFNEESFPFEMYYKDENIEIDIVFSLLSVRTHLHILSYVNNQKTYYDGSHVDGFIDGLKAVLLNYRKNCCHNKENFEFLGLGVVIHVKKENVNYYESTKSKIDDGEIYKAVNELTKSELKPFYFSNEKLVQSNLVCGHCRKKNKL